MIHLLKLNFLSCSFREEPVRILSGFVLATEGKVEKAVHSTVEELFYLFIFAKIFFGEVLI